MVLRSAFHGDEFNDDMLAEQAPIHPSAEHFGFFGKLPRFLTPLASGASSL